MLLGQTSILVTFLGTDSILLVTPQEQLNDIVPKLEPSAVKSQALRAAPDCFWRQGAVALRRNQAICSISAKTRFNSTS